MSSTVYASDASLSSGAAVCAELPQDTVAALWLGSDKRGHYTRLDGVFRACLRQLYEDEDYYEEGVREDFASYDSPPFKAPLLYFDFVEICGGARGCIKSCFSLGLSRYPRHL